MRSLIMPVVGLPNVGKSTIINALMGKKVSIVTHKPHTTRSMIFGLRQLSGAEILFVDTPGFEQVKTKLGTMIFNSMNEYIKNLEEMMLVLNAANPQIEKFSHLVPRSIVVLNKIDYVRKPKLLPIIQQLQDLEAKQVFLVCAQSGDGIQDLANYLDIQADTSMKTPEGSLYIEDIAAYACECVREKILMQFDKEIPYKVWVYPKSVKIPKESAWNIMLNIVVPKRTYKAILLGKNGQNIKSIGMASRIELSAKLRQSGYLGLEIVIDEKLWQKDHVYEQLGWQNPKV